MDQKITKLQARYDELERELQTPDIFNDSSKLQRMTKEYNEIGDLLKHVADLARADKEIAEMKKTISDETDSELVQIAEEELISLNIQKKDAEKAIDSYLNPADPLDKKDIIVEIRAGAGGDEAALFAANLFRMYARYAEKNGWKVQTISSNKTGIGGFKEIIIGITGTNVYSRLKYESGTHRVQRVPDTEKSGRVHTSAATVAILPKAEEIDIEIKPDDLDIQATNSSGAGGQSVNTSYSAIRIVHLPTNTVVVCQDERSQKQNKEKAMQVLRARLLADKQEAARKERADNRKTQIGTGDRSEKIRTYNFPQDRVSDHRIKKNFSNLESIMDGGIDVIIDQLKAADTA